MLSPTWLREMNPTRSVDDHLAARRFLSTVVRDEGTATTPRPREAAMLVREVMHPGVVAAHEEAAFKEIVDAIIRNRISAVPVIDRQRRVVGVVSESDLLSRLAGGHLVLPAGHLLTSYIESRRKLRGATAGELMTAPAVVTTPETTVEQAAHLCARQRVRRLPVVDGDGVLVGIVTRADLLRVFLRPDRDIRDEVCRGVRQLVPSRDADGVEVEVTEGVVSLHGMVEGRVLADAVAQHAQAVSGVIAVDGSRLQYRLDDRRASERAADQPADRPGS